MEAMITQVEAMIIITRQEADTAAKEAKEATEVLTIIPVEVMTITLPAVEVTTITLPAVEVKNTTLPAVEAMTTTLSAKATARTAQGAHQRAKVDPKGKVLKDTDDAIPTVSYIKHL